MRRGCARGARLGAAALGAVLAPLLEQAAKTNMALATSAPTFLLNIFGNFLLRSSRSTASNWTMVVPRKATTLLRTKRNPPGDRIARASGRPWRDVPSLRRSPARAQVATGDPGRRIGEERLERQLGGAEQRGVNAEGRGHDPDERRRAQGAPVELGLQALDDERMDPAEPATQDDEPGSRTLTRPASPRPSQRPTWSSAASATADPRAASRRTASTSLRPPPSG